MANRVFQSVIYQMKDAINRVVGVVDETGTVIFLLGTEPDRGKCATAFVGGSA